MYKNKWEKCQLGKVRTKFSGLNATLIMGKAQRVKRGSSGERDARRGARTA